LTAAGEPRDGAPWDVSAEEGPSTAWSVENLEALEFQKLVDLQAVAGDAYRRSGVIYMYICTCVVRHTHREREREREKALRPLPSARRT